VSPTEDGRNKTVDYLKRDNNPTRHIIFKLLEIQVRKNHLPMQQSYMQESTLVKY